MLDDIADFVAFMLVAPAIIGTWILRSLTLHWLWGSWFDGSMASTRAHSAWGIVGVLLWTLSTIVCWAGPGYLLSTF